MKKLNPPFGYFGSKSNLALRLCKELPAHNCWVEAFCGSAALTLSKTQAQIEIINDIDNEITNLFEQLRKNHKKLCEMIALTPYSEQELIDARKDTQRRISKVERARRFLVQSMMAVNGLFGSDRGGFSYSDSYSRSGKEARVSRWYNLPDRLEEVVERLKNVRIENKDAKRLVKRFSNRPATLMYLDPPYYADRSNGYTIDANDKKFHKELLQLVSKSKCMIFISGYENELYNSILTTKKGWSKKRIKTSTKDPKGKTHSRTEVVWMNKYFKEGQRLQRVNINLTKREKANKKVNPIRKPKS